MIERVRLVFGNNGALSVKRVDLDDGLESTQEDCKEEHCAFGEEAARGLRGPEVDGTDDQGLCNLTEDDSTMEDVSSSRTGRNGGSLHCRSFVVPQPLIRTRSAKTNLHRYANHIW